jgi:hypothetical protein
MPACILRVAGSTAKVRRFLCLARLKPYRVFWKGDLRHGGRVVQQSGFSIELSSAEGLPDQARQAIRFARRHKADLDLITQLGFRTVSIDFGLHDRATDDRPWPTYAVPVAISRLAAGLGATIDLSFYGPAEDGR